MNGNQIRDGLAAAKEYRTDDLEAALRELVELKDGPRDEDYERRKPAAWRKARDLLAQKPA